MTKTAQEQRKAPPRPHRHMAAYPDYTKSLANQRYRSPGKAGLERGIQTGITGAVLGALIARVMSDRLGTVAAGAGIGGLAGGIAGFNSGKQQAESDYSKLLFMRRRMGVNEPGELDAVLQNPELAGGIVQKQAGIGANIAKGLGVAGATGAGWYLGTEGLSRVMGYHDDPAARHLGGGISAGNLGALALLLATKGKAGTSALLHQHPLLPASAIGMETVPTVVRSARDVANSTAEQARGQIAPTLTRILNSGAGRGAVAGAGVAGLGALITGLSRAKSDDEIRKDKSRTGMVSSDFLKYLLPALVGGGVVGSMIQKPNNV